MALTMFSSCNNYPSFCTTRTKGRTPRFSMPATGMSHSPPLMLVIVLGGIICKCNELGNLIKAV